MHILHADDIWTEFPELVAGVLSVRGINATPTVAALVGRFDEIARARLAAGSEGEMPEIKAWRRTFSKMGLKPTQYRCAAESLLRRFRKEGALPTLHPLVDLCNSISLAFAIPIAVFDVARVSEFLEIRHASGEERYAGFSGELEHPEPREIIFADALGNAHARRWANRQSGLSAVRADTHEVLIVVEALHESAPADVAKLITTLTDALITTWGASPRSAVLRRDAPRFDF